MSPAHVLIHDLFLLVINLAQQRDVERIIQLFIEGVNSRGLGLGLSRVASPDETDAPVEPIATRDSSFGYLALNSENPLPDDLLSVLRNAVRMLAIVLENRRRAALLQDTNQQLEELVTRRTRDLERTNASLREEIEDRRRAEAAVRDSERNLSELMNGITAAVVVHGADTQILQCNAAACALLGLSADQLRQRDANDPQWRLRHEDGRVMSPAEYPANRVIATGQPVRRAVIGVDRPGCSEPVWVLIDAIPQLDAEGNVQAVFVTFMDVTEHRDAAAALRRSEELLRATGRMARVGGWELDVVTSRVTWTEEVYRIHEVPLDFAPDLENGVHFFHPEDRPRLEAAIRRTIDTGEPYDLELRFVTGKGRSLWTRTQGRAHYEEGEVVKLSGIFQDITDRKTAEQERERLEAQLQHARKMEALGRLAGGVAHDFNNLLTVILGNVEILARGPSRPTKDVDGDFLLQQIREAATRGATLTQQLLTFGRRQSREPRLLDVPSAVESTIDMLHNVLGGNLRLELHLPDEPLGVLMDPGQLEQVVMNLVLNARDAMADGGTLTVEMARMTVDEAQAAQHADAHPGDYVRLTVADTGGGLSGDALAHLFEPFYTTKPAGKGTGLGLATVYAITHQAGGHIVVDSRPEQGCAMHVFLPAADAVSPAAAREGGRRRIEARSRSSANGTILVCEDEEMVRHLAVRLLRYEGYTVLEASDAEEAAGVLRASEAPVDLLLTDLLLPGSNGRQLAEQLRTQSPGLRVIFMSGYSADVIGEDEAMEEIAPFIPKPFEARVLLDRVAEVMAAARE